MGPRSLISAIWERRHMCQHRVPKTQQTTHELKLHFPYHLVGRADAAILGDGVVAVISDGKAVGFAPWLAVAAGVLGAALVIHSLVLLARVIWNGLLLDELVSTRGGATLQ